jgi:DNA repair exonuclease SbcCD ATPase subunit
MIKKLIIQNFQSHGQSELNFDDGVNVIVGGSDSGKSAVIRALKWVIFNKPTGNAFRSNWGGVTQVDLVIDGNPLDNNVVSRVRNGSKENSYHYNNQIFQALKGDIPSEISNFLELDWINFQQQLDSPFLLSETPGDVARFFNSIAGIDKIDTGLKNLNSWLRKAEAEKTSEENRIDELASAISNYDYLDEAEADLDEAETLDEEFSDVSKDIEELGNRISTLKKLEKEIDAMQELLEAKLDVEKIEELFSEKTNLAWEKNELFKKIDTLKDLDDKIHESSHLNGAKPILEKIENKNIELNDVSGKLSDLNTLISNLRIARKKLSNNKKQENSLKEYFKNNFPEVCPLCGTKIK